MTFALRPYQVRGRNLIAASIKTGHRKILVVAPTGSGKTVVFAGLAAGHLAKRPDGRVLVLVHRAELIRQTVAKLRDAGVDRVSAIAPGFAVDAEARVTVASVQTLLQREELPAASFVIVDEAHHHVAAEWGRVAAHYSAAFVLGFTATPMRADGTPMGDLFEDLVVLARVRELMDLGHLCECDVIAPPRRTRDLSDDPIVAYSKHAPGRPAFVFAASVADAHALAARFAAAGYSAACVEGATDPAERADAIARFTSGELTILVNVFCLTEGVDVPRAEICILARGCTSVAAYMQMIGRVLRPYPGKERALLIDLRGAVHDHGLPDEHRVFSLDGKAISGGEAPVKSCPACSHVCPISIMTCPNCGHEFASDREEDREDLIKITPAERERSFFIGLLRQASDRGYKPGWVAHRFVEKFGRFPRNLWGEFCRTSEAA